MNIQELIHSDITAKYLNRECDCKFAEVYNYFIEDGLSAEAAEKAAWLGVVGMLIGVVEVLVYDYKAGFIKL